MVDLPIDLALYTPEISRSSCSCAVHVLYMDKFCRGRILSGLWEGIQAPNSASDIAAVAYTQHRVITPRLYTYPMSLHTG